MVWKPSPQWCQRLPAFCLHFQDLGWAAPEGDSWSMRAPKGGAGTWVVTLFGRDYGDGAIFLSDFLRRELVQAFRQLALLGKGLVSAGCANHRKPAFLPALPLRLNGESLKTVIVKLGVWAYAKSSFLLLPQGNDRALKTNRLIFIMSVLDHLTSCLRVVGEDIYCILLAKSPFVWTGCIVLRCMELLITATTSTHPHSSHAGGDMAQSGQLLSHPLGPWLVLRWHWPHPGLSERALWWVSEALSFHGLLRWFDISSSYLQPCSFPHYFHHMEELSVVGEISKYSVRSWTKIWKCVTRLVLPMNFPSYMSWVSWVCITWKQMSLGSDRDYKSRLGFKFQPATH